MTINTNGFNVDPSILAMFENFDTKTEHNERFAVLSYDKAIKRRNQRVRTLTTKPEINTHDPARVGRTHATDIRYVYEHTGHRPSDFNIDLVMFDENV